MPFSRISMLASDIFRVVPVMDGLLGGHFAVRDARNGRMIGRSLRLDRPQAEVLMWELENVHQLAQKEAVND